MNIQGIRQFLKEDLWKIKLTNLPKRQAFLYRQLRVLIITVSEFTKDKCGEKASALTFLSVLSMVPVLAMAVGVASIFGLRDFLERELKKFLGGQEEVLDQTLKFADNMLSNSSGGVIAGISAVFLVYAVLRLLNNIEVAFNDIWNTKKGRSLKRKLTDYMSVILLGPLILILSSSATVFITTSIEELTESISLLGFFRPIILFFVKLVPYTLIWFLLFLMYVVFPNTTVKIKPALIAGVLAGTAYQLTQFAWVEGQVYLGKYSVIYASLAALPLFLIWLQLSWTILLFGAEFAFALQNVRNWSWDDDSLIMNHRSKRKITLLVLRHIVHHYKNEDCAIDFEQLCMEVNIPRRFVREVVDDMENARLINRVHANDDVDRYQPALDYHKMDVFLVLDRMDRIGLDRLPQEEENEGYTTVDQVMNQLDEAVKISVANKKIADL
ncbi:YihY/virulence factor BrkB family protein [Marinoscillum furvescens]|uniref:tRNA-processing RNAse BN n=1 Tax=Marinoscillum furvescens DSM 4134 TaxID=1122208 RepID=A0A3D9L932_MARFU|nr:YihY/virulence factor BrkB family protein [Marinoscillum furvescens]REE02184.1 tRNA-processing RNAse BN [Marinoscillum furvescens DSM 4134]